MKVAKYIKNITSINATYAVAFFCLIFSVNLNGYMFYIYILAFVVVIGSYSFIVWIKPNVLTKKFMIEGEFEQGKKGFAQTTIFKKFPLYQAFPNNYLIEIQCQIQFARSPINSEIKEVEKGLRKRKVFYTTNDSCLTAIVKKEWDYNYIKKFKATYPNSISGYSASYKYLSDLYEYDKTEPIK